MFTLLSFHLSLGFALHLECMSLPQPSGCMRPERTLCTERRSVIRDRGTGSWLPLARCVCTSKPHPHHLWCLACLTAFDRASLPRPPPPGPQEWVWRELKAISDMKFRWGRGEELVPVQVRGVRVRACVCVRTGVNVMV